MPLLECAAARGARVLAAHRIDRRGCAANALLRGLTGCGTRRVHEMSIRVQNCLGTCHARVRLAVDSAVDHGHAESSSNPKRGRDVTSEALIYGQIRRSRRKLMQAAADRHVAANAGWIHAIDVEDVTPTRTLTRFQNWRHVRHPRAPRAADVQASERRAHERAIL